MDSNISRFTYESQLIEKRLAMSRFMLNVRKSDKTTEDPPCMDEPVNNVLALFCETELHRL